MTILSQVLEPMLVNIYRIINKILFLGLVPQPGIKTLDHYWNYENWNYENYWCERGTLLTGRSVNPTLIDRTSLRASKRLLQQSTTVIGVNRVY